MFRRVIVAYDGSPSAEDALALGQRLRDPDGGELLLACVIPGRTWHLPGHAPVTEEAFDEASTVLAEARAGIAAGIPVGVRMPVATSPARGLTELAEAEGADLIAIGSAHGATPGRIGLARTAGRLLQGAPCAVAVAPPGLREKGPFRHVGVAFDASPEAAAALTSAFAIARAGRSAVTLYSALDERTVELEAQMPSARLAMQQRLDDAAGEAPEGVNPCTVLLLGRPGSVIAEECEGVVDLLVTGSCGYGPLHRALLGSVSEELLDRATHPVLVVSRRPVSAPSASVAAAAADGR
jgi:nucleotide-binding universal stress UspA family protein